MASRLFNTKRAAFRLSILALVAAYGVACVPGDDDGVVSVSEEGLAARPWEIGGSADMGATMLVSLDEIGSISCYEVDGKRALINLGKSAGLVVGGAILLGAVLIVALAIAL